MLFSFQTSTNIAGVRSIPLSFLTNFSMSIRRQRRHPKGISFSFPLSMIVCLVISSFSFPLSKIGCLVISSFSFPLSKIGCLVISSFSFPLLKIGCLVISSFSFPLLKIGCLVISSFSFPLLEIGCTLQIQIRRNVTLVFFICIWAVFKYNKAVSVLPHVHCPYAHVYDCIMSM